MKNALRYFLEVARAGSFRQAGDTLHLAPSAINRQISLLEKDLGAPLFERSRGRNRLRLTAAGEAFIVHVRSALEQLEQARSEIDDLKGLRAGNVVVGAPETFTRDFLPDFLAQFNESYPRISFRIVVAASPQLLQLLLKDEIEMALAYNPSIGHSIHVNARLEQRTCIMVRADHPLARRSWVRVSDLAEYPIVVPDHGTSMRGLYDQIFAKLKLKPRSILTTTSYEMLRTAARAGLGLAIVNEYLTSRDSLKPDVVFVPIRDPIAKPSVLACCTRSGRRLSVAAMLFIEKLREAFATLRKTT